MNYLTLPLIKQHLNINADYTGEDAYLTTLGGAVEDIVERHIDDSFDALAEENDGVLPLGLQHACLVLLGTYYSNRESVAYTTVTEVPTSYVYLCDAYRRYGNTDEYDPSGVLAELEARVAELEAYRIYDEGRTITGTGLDVTTEGQVTDIEVEVIDQGEY